MPETHPAPGTRPAGAPPYEPVVRAGTPPPQLITGTHAPSRVNHPVLLPDDTDVDDDLDPVSTQVPALPASTTVPHASPAAAPVAHVYPAPKRHWYAYAASGLAGAVLVTGLYGLLAARSGPLGGRAGSDSAPGGLAVSDTALLDRRADTLALAVAAFGMRATMFDSRRMPCSGLARGLAQVEDAWLGYNMARKDMLAGSDPTRDARDKSLYADVRGVEVKFERSSCTRP
jgi:hypothetical protein